MNCHLVVGIIRILPLLCQLHLSPLEVVSCRVKFKTIPELLISSSDEFFFD